MRTIIIGYPPRLLFNRNAKRPSDFHVFFPTVSWGESVEHSIDRIILLWIPPEIRLQRLRQREIQRHGKVDEEFIAWAGRYDTGDLSVRSRALHKKWMATMRCPILRLEGDLSESERLSRSLEFVARSDPAPRLANGASEPSKTQKRPLR